MTRRPNNLTVSLPPGRWRNWWPNCKPCAARSSAPRRAHPTWLTISANFLVIEGRMIGVPSWSDSTDEHSARPASACGSPASNDQMIMCWELAMRYIEPIRPLDEVAALEWLRCQPGRLTNLPAAELGRRWGWQRQRASRRLKAWQKAGLVTRRGNAITVADKAPKSSIDVAEYVAAIFLAGAAAFFSI